jgi:hypothetical protein
VELFHNEKNPFLSIEVAVPQKTLILSLSIFILPASCKLFGI